MAISIIKDTDYMNEANAEVVGFVRNFEMEYHKGSLDAALSEAVKNILSEGEYNNEFLAFFFTDMNGSFRIKYVKYDKDSEISMPEFDSSSIPNGDCLETSYSRGILAYNPYIPLFEHAGFLTIPCFAYALDKNHNELYLDNFLPLVKQTYRFIQKTKRYPIFGFEKEFHLIQNTSNLDISLINKKFLFEDTLSLFQVKKDNYLGKMSNLEMKFYKNLIDELKGSGIVIDSFHKEVGFVQYEVSTKPTTPIHNYFNDIILEECIREAAEKTDYYPLFLEKPFMNCNGNGKHVHVSLARINQKEFNYFESFHPIFSETDTPLEHKGFHGMDANAKMLISNALSKYEGMYKSSVYTYENQFRLGGYEAPPLELNIQYDNVKNRDASVCFLGNRYEMRLYGSSNDMGELAFDFLGFMNKYLEEELNDDIDTVTELNKNFFGAKNREIDIQSVMLNKAALFNSLYKDSELFGKNGEANAHMRAMQYYRNILNFMEFDYIYAKTNNIPNEASNNLVRSMKKEVDSGKKELRELKQISENESPRLHSEEIANIYADYLKTLDELINLNLGKSTSLKINN